MSNAQTSRISIADLAAKKQAGEKFAMLTSYEQMSAAIFDEAGIPVLLVGDSAGNNFLGFENTIPVTVDELIPMARAVVAASKNAMVIADFPFGSYESSPEQALATGIRFFKEAKVGAVKLEGGIKVVPQIKKLISAGIP
ncbi:MAG: 3-methyl-2-oxobutanoate hydroxymethyltransferase, partial [Actinomycetes bacterium]